MSEQTNGAACEVSYTRTLLPGSGMAWTAAIWIDACNLCGALTLHRDAHNEWHFPPSAETTAGQGGAS